MRVTLLGTGGSAGVPMIGGSDGHGDWGACDPADGRNRRSRCSLMVRRLSAEGAERQTTVVVDAAPEFRLQCAAAGVRQQERGHRHVGVVAIVVAWRGMVDPAKRAYDVRVFARNGQPFVHVLLVVGVARQTI